MVAAILQSAGYKTGLFTSPHLRDFRERIRVDGKMISRQYINRFIEANRPVFQKINPSFFEWTTILAFDYFRSKKVEIAVIETGLGGRLDSTNLITPLLSIITNIGWDHAALLGNSLKKIASEKAGIIKPGVPVVIGEYQKEVYPVFKAKAGSVSSTVFCASKQISIQKINSDRKPWGAICADFSYKGETLYPGLCSDLAGNYQLKNIATTVAGIEVLRPILRINRRAVYAGIRNVHQITGFTGRWSILQKRPLVIADTAHNPEGLRLVINQIKSIRYRRLHVVLGMVEDKDRSGMLKLFPEHAIYYFCKPAIPRGLNVNQLQLSALKLNLKGQTYSSVKLAYSAALNAASKKDLIYIGGSTFVIAEVI